MSEAKHNFPEWKTFYQAQPVETMPWFHADLDPDLEAALNRLGIRGGSALDLGTGPGTQAIQLARRGFEVTGTDLSQDAIVKADALAQKEDVQVQWKTDDILDTRLQDRFDLVFDRGCFHVLDPERRPDYVRTVAGLIQPGGHLFLKCFSRKQPGESGPYRFAPPQIESIFSGPFQVVSIDETIYQGTLEVKPFALFCVLRRQA